MILCSHLSTYTFQFYWRISRHVYFQAKTLPGTKFAYALLKFRFWVFGILDCLFHGTPALVE